MFGKVIPFRILSEWWRVEMSYVYFYFSTCEQCYINAQCVFCLFILYPLIWPPGTRRSLELSGAPCVTKSNIFFSSIHLLLYNIDCFMSLHSLLWTSKNIKRLQEFIGRSLFVFWTKFAQNLNLFLKFA